MCNKNIGVIMSIQSVNSISFSGKRVTKNGNEYDKTNAGKYTGMGVGAAAGAGFGIKVYHDVTKTIKEAGNEFENGVKDVLGDTLTSIKNRFSNLAQDTGTAVENNIDEITEMSMKMTQKAFKVVPVILGLGGLLAGLGLGAITDGIINHTRAKKADNTEKTEA